MSQLIKCSVCNGYFNWDDDVVIVDDEYYHENCVELYPMGFIAMLDGDPLGETENDDGEMACMALNDGEYIDVEDEE